MRTAIGIDIGGTNVNVAMVNDTGTVLQKRSLLVRELTTGRSFLNALKDTIEQMWPEHGGGALPEGIGIGTPGANIFRGTIERAFNLPWDNLPVVSFLSATFDLPVCMTNDASLFAVGEKTFGKASDLHDFAVITLGTGVGAGIYCGGSLLIGRNGLAGEVGHLIIEKDGRPCKCGRKGCLERYVSASGVVLTAREHLSDKYSSSLLHALPAEMLTAELIAESAASGDTLALEIFRETGERLGLALANLAAYFDPEAIFLSGGLALAGDILFQPAMEAFNRNLLGIYPRQIPVLPGSLPGHDAAVLGAAALVWDTRGKHIQETIIN